MISVIIPVYNVSDFLPRCLDSVLCQAHLREVILVDDGSTDDSGTICDRYGETDHRVVVIHKKNGGLSSARNAGLDIAQGEYIAFVDSDDYLEPDAYRVMLETAQRTRSSLVCAGRYDLDGGTGRKERGLCPETAEVITGKELVGRIFTWNGVDSAAWDKLYRRNLFDGIRYPVGKICEDVPVTYRLALRAGKAALVPQPLYNYYHRPGSITTAGVSEKNFHFSAHVQAICEDLASTAPELLPEARSLLCWSLAHPMMLCQEAGQVSAFRDSYRRSRKALQKEVPFFLTSPLVSGKARLQYLLLVLGLFGPAWRLRCRLHPEEAEERP